MNRNNSESSDTPGKEDVATITKGVGDIQTTVKKEPDRNKVDILLQPAGNAPILKKKRWLVDNDKNVGCVADFVRKYMKLPPSESLFFYVNQTFAPAPDMNIQCLYDCYGSDGTLVLHYCKTQAWG